MSLRGKPPHISRNRFLVVAAAVVLVPMISAGGERELWALGKQHLGALEDHAGMVDACRAYAAAGPQDPFLPVARALLW